MSDLTIYDRQTSKTLARALDVTDRAVTAAAARGRLCAGHRIGRGRATVEDIERLCAHPRTKWVFWAEPDFLHPTGRCTCAGEGTCDWCAQECPDCGEPRSECECEPVDVEELKADLAGAEAVIEELEGELDDAMQACNVLIGAGYADGTMRQRVARMWGDYREDITDYEREANELRDLLVKARRPETLYEAAAPVVGYILLRLAAWRHGRRRR